MFLCRQLLFTYVFSRRLKRKDKSGILMAVIVLLIVAVSIGFDIVINNNELRNAVSYSSLWEIVSTIFFCVMNMVVMTLLVNYFYKASYLEAFYAVTLGYLAEHSEYALEAVVMSFLPDVQRTLGFQGIEWIFLFVYAFFIDRIFAGRIIRDRHYRTQTGETIFLLFVSGLIVMFLSAIATQDGYVETHGIYAFIFCVFALATQIERQRKDLQTPLTEQLQYLFSPG